MKIKAEYTIELKDGKYRNKASKVFHCPRYAATDKTKLAKFCRHMNSEVECMVFEMDYFTNTITATSPIETYIFSNFKFTEVK